MSNLLIQAFHHLGTQFAAWRRREQAIAELSQMDDRSLADIGITRGQIPYVVNPPRAKTTAHISFGRSLFNLRLNGLLRIRALRAGFGRDSSERT